MELLDYLREENAESFSPKDGKNPSKEKYLDSRKARNQNVAWLSRDKDINVWLQKGVIWFISYRTKKPKCLPNGWRRTRKKWSYNGVYERGYEGAGRWMRNGWGKQSRQAQRLWREVEEQIQDYFAEKEFTNESV